MAWQCTTVSGLPHACVKLKAQTGLYFQRPVTQSLALIPKWLWRERSLLGKFLLKSHIFVFFSDLHPVAKDSRQPPPERPALHLLGECVAHSGAVRMVLDFRDEGMVSCGVADGLVILWKVCNNEHVM